MENLEANLKTVDPKIMHLTLKFLGQTKNIMIPDIEKSISEVTQDKKPYSLKIIGTGIFPNKNYIKIIWVGVVDNGQTKKISDELDKKLSKIGFKKEKRDFHPHLTLARVKSSKNKEKIIDFIEKYKNFEFQESIVDCIELKQSELTPKGPIYTTIKKINI